MFAFKFIGLVAAGRALAADRGTFRFSRVAARRGGGRLF